jgi:two-component system OmpR family sensor kinase
VEIVPLAMLIGFALWQFDQQDHIPLGAPARDFYAFLGLAAAGVATGAAIVARISPQSTGSPERRLAGPLAFYGIVMIPASVLQLSTTPPPGVAVGKVVASGLFLVLMGWALLPRKSGMRWTTVVIGATVITALAGAAGQFLLGRVAAAWFDTNRVVVTGWWVVAFAFVVSGAMWRRPATWRIGIGLSMIAVAHLEGLTSPSGAWMPDLEFAGLRLLGLVVVLLVLARRAGRAVRSASQRERIRSERLAAAERAARRVAMEVAERDHEIRNVVSGLSGVGHLLSTGVDRLDVAARATLGSAVQAELGRLNELLSDASTGDNGDTLIPPLLTQLAALRRARGGVAELDIEEPGPRAQMPADELAQVMTNLLANCDRHAPGAPVRIRADTQGGVVRITVTDEGPGLPPQEMEIRRTVPARDYDPSAGGRGIGLRVCRRLLAAHSGTLQLRPAARAHGCTVEVRLPSSVEAPTGSSVFARQA